MIQTLFPTLFEYQKQYLTTPQTSCLSLSSLKIYHLHYSGNQISIFDSSSFVNYCSPSQSPKWAAETNFSSFIHHLEFLGCYFDLDPSATQKYQDHFLQTYYQNIRRRILTPQGLRLFITQEFIFSIKAFLLTNEEEKARKMLSQFEEFTKRGNQTVSKFLGN